MLRFFCTESVLIYRIAHFRTSGGIKGATTLTSLRNVVHNLQSGHEGEKQKCRLQKIENSQFKHKNILLSLL